MRYVGSPESAVRLRPKADGHPAARRQQGRSLGCLVKQAIPAADQLYEVYLEEIGKEGLL